MKTHISQIPDREIQKADEVLVAPSLRPTATEVVIRFSRVPLVAPSPTTAGSVPDAYTIVGLYDSPREREDFIERCHRVRPPVAAD